jgi:putative transcriptional regulator
MPIISHLAELMAKEKIRNVNRLSELTGVSTPTLYRLFDGTNTRVDYATLISLCKYFNCTISDIIEYVPDSEKGE